MDGSDRWETKPNPREGEVWTVYTWYFVPPNEIEPTDSVFTDAETVEYWRDRVLKGPIPEGYMLVRRLVFEHSLYSLLGIHP